MASKGDGKRKFLSLEQRVAVIKKLDGGASCRAVAQDFGCGKTQIAKIKTERDAIMKEWESGARSDMKYVKRRKTLYEDLNNLVWDWFCKARSKEIPVSGKMIQEKALMLALEMGHDDFSASNGWLGSWQRRYGIKLATLSGESAEVQEDVVADWTKRLGDITKEYKPQDIFNADETGLFYRALPERSMVIKGDPRRGIKIAKERITVLLACSATGEKLKPLVIGKSENPRCFKGCNKASLPVTYRSNKKAWMTSVLFKEWLDRLNSRMKLTSRKILLFVDNCGAHPDVSLSHVRLAFLPPNTTSRLQPCDAGIIATVKSHYRKRLVRHVLSEMDEANTASDLAKRIDIKDAIIWLSLAWTGVSESTIRKCFAKCGFQDSPDSLPEETHVVDEEAPGFDRVMGAVPWEDFVHMDDATSTTNYVDSNWEEELLAVARGQRNDSDEADSDEAEEDPSTSVICSLEAIHHSKKLVDYALQCSNPAMVEAASKLQDIVQEDRLKKAAIASQKSIKDYFTSR